MGMKTKVELRWPEGDSISTVSFDWSLVLISDDSELLVTVTSITFKASASRTHILRGCQQFERKN